MKKVMDAVTARIDGAKDIITKAFHEKPNPTDNLLQDYLNKADMWLTTALARCEELNGENVIEKMSIDDLFDEAEELEEKIAELGQHGGHQCLPALKERLETVVARLKKEGEL
jgi:hypothetical protein